MSANPVNALRCEHANMRGVLVLIRDQLDVLERGGVPDFVLLANALYYMRQFPSILHHPKEDMVFEHLAAADPGLAEAVEHTRQEHEQIYRLEDWLIECTLNAPKPGTSSRERLLEFGREYLELQRHHSEREERVLFPRAATLLGPEDWTEIERNFKAVDDPVFGRHGGERYELLYEHLIRASDRA